MKLNLEGLKNTEFWKENNIVIPTYDIEKVKENTHKEPVWVHFGAGNIFRAFIAGLQNKLIEQGLSDRGIIAVESFDLDIIDRIYRPYDNLTLNITMNANRTLDKEVYASLCEGLKGNETCKEDFERLKEIFRSPSLQMVSFTITEKGYSLKNINGDYSNIVLADIENGPKNLKHTCSIVASLLFERYKAGKFPIALVSMDNCSHNGEKLRNAVLDIAEQWKNKGFVNEDFISYISDEKTVSFPWSMIDKITPRPADNVYKIVAEAGIEDMEPITTSGRTFIAPFVNAEKTQYLVVEDNFPNGRPALEKAGVYFCDRETVNKTEIMKVTTCLNPLHTGLAVYGCLLGYNLICDEMKDESLVKLVKRLGYTEGLPVVTNPGIISPETFINEVVYERLCNPFMPDTPQRIATDTSQKVGIRIGETIKGYIRMNRNLNDLVSAPLVLAGWLRYLLAVDDNLNPIEVSSDPLKDELQEKLKNIKVGDVSSYNGELKTILNNKHIFGLDLTETSLADRIEEMFLEEIKGAGAVRNTLDKYLK